MLKRGPVPRRQRPKRQSGGIAATLDLVRRYVEKNDTKGIEHIKLQAKSLAQPIIAGLAKTNEQHATMERARVGDQRFAPSEGQWSSLTGKYRTAAEHLRVLEEGARDRAAGLRKIAMGEDGPIAKAAIEQLQAALKGATADLAQLRSGCGVRTMASRSSVAGTSRTRGTSGSSSADPSSRPGTTRRVTPTPRSYEIADRMRDRVRPQWGTSTRAAWPSSATPSAS
ncbi:MAG: hypothetical protein HS111_25130 [Kofleriaceae bacterium]|nr:hypothetical protein [Kofleriaceae bacterium]